MGPTLLLPILLQLQVLVTLLATGSEAGSGDAGALSTKTLDYHSRNVSEDQKLLSSYFL